MTPGPTARDVPLLRARDEYAHESAAGARNGPAQGPRRRTVRTLLPAPRRIGNERGGGFEALLRWNHPMRRLVSPADFIPIAEETGLIVPLGEWVLKAACAEAVNWPEHIKVAVNLSPAQLNCRNLVSMVTAALQESGMPPRKLQLEISETVLLQNRSFIQDLSNGAEPLAIVNAVAGLAKCLNMTSTAEGVETQQQMDVLQAIGCTEMQGYLFSH
ncbi:MAG: EAL domain-containing protein [Pseudolabrys sp.]